MVFPSSECRLRPHSGHRPVFYQRPVSSEAVFNSHRSAVSGAKGRFCRKQTFAGSGSTSQLQDKTALGIGIPNVRF